MKGVLLLSGGIDSPVAGLMMLERGMDLVLLHMDNRPYADDHQVEKVRGLVALLSGRSGKELKAYTMPHGRLAQAAIAEGCDRRYHCVLCKRAMLRGAEIAAAKVGACCIVTGESLGQVASQTLRNLRVIDSATSLPVLRPLIGLDKQEIVERARRLGSFELSTVPGTCCTLAPARPATAAQMERVLREEAKLDIAGLMKSEMAGLLELD
jgi:thiamine biosynthesis protein ThiI